MKKIKNIFIHNQSMRLALAAIISFLVIGCVYIDSVSVIQTYDGKEVSYAHANDKATFTIKGHIECKAEVKGTNFVIGFLAPKSWNVAANTKVTYKCDLADDHSLVYNMSIIPASSLPKNGGGRTWLECLTQEYGVGTNVLDDMEWVVFQTDQKWDIANGQTPSYTIYIKINVGTQNLKCHLGFFVNHTDDGFSGGNDHKKFMMSQECFEVVGGTGATIDFCSNHYNKVAPMSALANDFVTFSFIGDVADNNLVGKNIYFQGIAHTASGKTYSVTEKNAKTLMKKNNNASGTYNITLWPMGYFQIPQNEEIDYIEYEFTNADGSVTIGQSDDDFTQLGIPLPTTRKPFIFKLSCD